MIKKNGTYCELAVKLNSVDEDDATLSIDVVNGQAIMSIISNDGDMIHIDLSDANIERLKKALEFSHSM